MAKRVQLIRHNTAGADAFLGKVGEMTVDTDRDELRLHDEITAGGVSIARADLANVNDATTAVAGKMPASAVVQLAQALIDIIANDAAIVSNDADIAINVADIAINVTGIATNVANIAAEITDRTNADTTLQTNIDVEEAARIAADAALPASIINTVYPVGAIYIGTTATNPNTLFGVGTWVATGVGSVLVGVGTSDAVYALDDTGGESTHQLITAEMPSHNHGGGIHSHIINIKNNSVVAGAVSIQGSSAAANDTLNTSNNTPAILNTDGSDDAHENMPPYLVVHMWERTA
jgi:hypothetical protein